MKLICVVSQSRYDSPNHENHANAALKQHIRY